MVNIVTVLRKYDTNKWYSWQSRDNRDGAFSSNNKTKKITVSGTTSSSALKISHLLIAYPLVLVAVSHYH